MTLSPISFDVVLFLLLSLVTGPSSMSISSLVLELIFFYKRLTRILEIGNTTVWVLPNIRRLGWVRDTKFGRNVSNEMLLNAAECQGYSFYRFWGLIYFLFICSFYWSTINKKIIIVIIIMTSNNLLKSFFLKRYYFEQWLKRHLLSIIDSLLVAKIVLPDQTILLLY